MTIADRNRVFAVSLASETVMAVLCGVAAIMCLGSPSLRLSVLETKPQFPWEPRILGLLPLYARVLSVSGALGLWGLLGGAWILRSFRKTTSYEILFYAIFFCALAVDASRSFMILSAGTDSPAAYGSLLSRLAFMGRWTGSLSLFAASLYSVSQEHEKAGRDIAIVLFLGAIFGTIMPLNSGALMDTFLFRPGYASILGFAWISISVLSLVNYFLAAFLKGSRDYAYMGIGLLMIMIGRDVLYSMTDAVLCAAGFILLASGCAICIRRCFRRALWQ